MKFKGEDGTFHVERFKAAVRIFITAQDILVDNSSYPIREIAENSHIFRTLGLGYANLGSLIMSYGLAYDSDDARGLTGAITAVMTGEAYKQSALLAQQLGPFKGYTDARCLNVNKPLAKDNVGFMLGVVELHHAAAREIRTAEKFNHVRQAAEQCWDEALALGRQHGYRRLRALHPGYGGDGLSDAFLVGACFVAAPSCCVGLVAFLSH
jgi:ribonucleoside-diphosphate reductase alpha chain